MSLLSLLLMGRLDSPAISMKVAVIVLAGVSALALVAAGIFAGLYFSDDSDTSTSVSAAPCGDRIYGHISTLTRDGDVYRVRYDPAWFTTGVTANAAAAEDGVVEPGQPVPNDNYVVDESHRLFTYLVPPDTHVTVLTRQGDPANFGATKISVTELAQLLGGQKPVDLFEPLDTGVWIAVQGDTVCSIDQQYVP
jgi:hypothetical protein